ncbi:MAG TPA: NAD(P)H-hydrate dehydratase [Thermoanaerobaculia bacterium]|nr:NAD(P)H-hydrate dehydratase [Thermoanaerobaculia bacterium]
MRLLDSAEAREIDRVAIERLGLPGLVLMENAASAAAEVIERRFPRARRVAIACGGGNNGGDGLALARQLVSRSGPRVSVLLCAREDELRGDAAVQWGALRAAVGASTGSDPVLELLAVDETSLDSGRAVLARADLVVDALFGIGLTRPIAGWREELVIAINAARAPRLALDVPSGLDASSSELLGPHVAADVTVTFFAPKCALVLLPAGEAAGEVWAAPLGVPERALDGVPQSLRLVTAFDLAVPLRPRQAHKGSFGHLVIVAGSPGKSGAAVLAARGALRTGAGLVTVAAPEVIRAEVDAGCVEAMTLPLPADGDLRLGTAAAATLAAFWDGKRAAAIGPGLGDEPAIASWIRELVARLDLPVVLDADGVNAFARRPGDLRGRRAPTVLTPHPGEVGRLLDRSAPNGAGERIAAARDAAAATGCVVVLKGYQTLIAEPDGGIHVNPTGNPGMATAGSGDVLTGAVGAWLARGLSPLEAARNGVFLHGLAGDLIAASRGEDGLVAGDLAEQLPRALLAARARRRLPRRGLAHAVGRAEVAELVADDVSPPRPRARRGRRGQ